MACVLPPVRPPTAGPCAAGPCTPPDRWLPKLLASAPYRHLATRTATFEDLFGTDKPRVLVYTGASPTTFRPKGCYWHPIRHNIEGLLHSGTDYVHDVGSTTIPYGVDAELWRRPHVLLWFNLRGMCCYKGLATNGALICEPRGRLADFVDADFPHKYGIRKWFHLMEPLPVIDLIKSKVIKELHGRLTDKNDNFIRKIAQRWAEVVDDKFMTTRRVQTLGW